MDCRGLTGDCRGLSRDCGGEFRGLPMGCRGLSGALKFHFVANVMRCFDCF